MPLCGTTDGKGRVTTLTEGPTLSPGTYRLTFDTGTYHRDQGIAIARQRGAIETGAPARSEMVDGPSRSSVRNSENCVTRSSAGAIASS